MVIKIRDIVYSDFSLNDHRVSFLIKNTSLICRDEFVASKLRSFSIKESLHEDNYAACSSSIVLGHKKRLEVDELITMRCALADIIVEKNFSSFLLTVELAIIKSLPKKRRISSRLPIELFFVQKHFLEDGLIAPANIALKILQPLIPLTLTPFMISHCKTLFENLISVGKPVSARLDRSVYKKLERHRVSHHLRRNKMFLVSEEGIIEDFGVLTTFRVSDDSCCLLMRNSFKHQNGKLDLPIKRNLHALRKPL